MIDDDATMFVRQVAAESEPEIQCGGVFFSGQTVAHVRPFWKFIFNNMKKTIVQLYGTIEGSGENSAANFVKRFGEAQNSADVVELHIHCPGGDVFEGNVIYNAILQSKKPVDVYIDGMAASMASIVMLAGRKIYMAENAFVMIHSPYTFASGTSDDLEKSVHLLRSMEEAFVAAYCKRTGKEAEAVREWMKGDNWFTAKEALAEKLIDGIVGTSNVEIAVPEDEIRKTKAESVIKQFSAFTKNNYKPKNKNKMDKQSLIDKFGLQGVTAQSSDAEIEAAIDMKINAGERQVAEMKKQQVKDAVTAAIAAKKITEHQRETYEAVGEKNGLEVLAKVFEGIRITQPITAQLNENGKTAEASHEGWDWEKWQQEDPRGLELLAEKEPETFKSLYDAYYKTNQ